MTKESKNLIDLFTSAYACEKGFGTKLDFTQAAKLWQQAADSGSEYAVGRLSRLFEEGLVSEQDFAKEKEHRPTQSANRGKILIIDDSPDTVMIVSSILKSEGFEPISAKDGIDGLEQTLFHHDLLAMLIDLQMPNMNGFEFISTLRDQKAFSNIPIIVITSFTNKKLITKGQSLNVSGWITKPVNKALLISTLEKLMRSSQGAV